MLTTSQLNERTRNRKNGGSSTGATKKKTPRNPKRARRDSDIVRARKLKQPRVAKLAELAAARGKISASGKRMCLWGDCTTIISLYNYEECCSRHQREWNTKSMVFPLD